MKHFLIFIVCSFVYQISWAGALPFKDKAVLVTGASSGLGNKIATTLASKGVFVYAGARKQADIDALSAQKNMLGVRLDVTEPDDIRAAVELVKAQGRGLHAVVNNAGVFDYAPMIEVSETELDFQMNVNVYGPYRITKAFAPMLIESKGRVTTIGSVAGFSSGAMFGPYSMTKFAVEAFTDALVSELRPFDVLASVIEPGNFKSDIMKNMHQRLERLKRDNRTTLFEKEYRAMAGFTAADRSNHQDAQPVADAVVHALFSEQPKVRYLVVPNQQEAGYAVGGLLKKVAQVNADHAFSFSREQLIDMLDAQIAKLKPAAGVR